MASHTFVKIGLSCMRGITINFNDIRAWMAQ